ncbi:hypothetical protein GIW06_13635 [Pseudomonas syringae]|uniref:Uncharacterized protein n=2 Tax=Pseudomonas syringae TaxID=317 RepID=A0AAJ4AV40_PSESX|nr:hypothetical protein Psyr_0240 [Pseudomonas syringae pv. syringae B728a]MCF4983551.1 hypothetical protein [Pseudomonas syringae]PYD11939.1 hypothetical protein DND47_23605 [Pseudomonas syringae pv. syringae]QHF06123.1 hypothetical protein N026_00865 [Pseudomonas syringae UB303]MCF5197202.1 hypothetical protein [Pseudomonas syringae]
MRCTLVPVPERPALCMRFMGASRATLRLLAKMMFRSMHFGDSTHPFREQVRSYALWAEARKPFVPGVSGIVYNDNALRDEHAAL